MDIRGAKAHVKRLLDFVENLKERQPRMYSSTKENLRELAVTCNMVVRDITELLQEESLNVTDSEFGAANDAGIGSVIQDMQMDISKLANFIGESNAVSNGTPNRSRVMGTYARVLHDVSNKKIAYPIISD